MKAVNSDRITPHRKKVPPPNISCLFNNLPPIPHLSGPLNQPSPNEPAC